MPTPPLTDAVLAETIAAWMAAGRNQSEAARQLGVDRRTYIHRLKVARERGFDRPAPVREQMERAGVDPTLATHGWVIEKTETGAGLSTFWKAPEATAEAFIAAAVDAITNALSPYEPLPPPAESDDDYLCLLGLPDWHMLMQAWGRETGEDYDIRIAERDFRQGVAALLRRCRSASTCVILGLGDQFHASADDARVGRGKHLGQVDGRILKAFEVATWAFVYAIREALTKFQVVKVRILPGNHDEHLAGMLAVAVKVAFINEPRVAVDTDPSYWWALEFGACLLVATHGDNMRSRKQIAMVAAQKFRREFGRTDMHFLLTGDKHHEKVADEPGWLCIQLRAMTAADAYSAMSFITPREVSMWTFHRARGRTDVQHELLPL